MLSPDEAIFLDAWAACSSDAGHTLGVAGIPTSSPSDADDNSTPSQGAAWSSDEHERFLDAMRLYPTGPWKAIAAHIGTRTPRQARTHAQKHKQKLHRRQRRLQRMQSYLVADCTAATAACQAVPSARHGIPWTPAEQERLREALILYPNGPWRLVADHVGTRSIRQVMSYGQKHRHKLGLPSRRSQEDTAIGDSQTETRGVETADAFVMDELIAHDLPLENATSNTKDDILERLLFDD